MSAITVCARQLLLFARVEARCCAFAVALLSGVTLSGVLPRLPVARYDLLLVYGLVLVEPSRRDPRQAGRRPRRLRGGSAVGG